MIRRVGIVILTLTIGTVMLASHLLDTRRQFYTEYYAWKLYVRTDGRDVDDPTRNVHYRNLIAMGPKVAHFLFREMERSRDWLLLDAIRTITRKTFTVDEMVGITGPEAEARLYIRWWKQDRNLTSAQFETLWNRCRACRSAGDQTGAELNLKNIRSLGLPVLPCLVDRIAAGATELIPLVKELTNGKASPDELLPATIRDWWKRNRDTWTLPDPNRWY